MPIGPGTRIGPYELTALLGEGGMGRVWRVRHMALERDDALKVLPDAFASDPDRLARFEREARILASLNHPNIAHVYGLERADGATALVMELVEGPTLADRIAEGPIAVDETLPIARQIAEAVESAHEQGIIHCDLKPSNVKVRPDGTVKVLDFGLAKALEAAPTSDLSHAPTITSPAMTGIGVMLGTAAYMAPEQARGRAVDKRSDIWAFGCVLYEMLTGQRAFDGEDVSDTLASVLKAEPDWSALPEEVPAALRLLMKECLAKDSRQRVRDLSAAIFVLGHGADLAPHAGDSPRLARAPRPLWRRVLPYAAAVSVTAGLAGAAAWFATPAGDRPVARFSVPLPPDAQLAASGVTRRARHLVAVSPDGLRIAYASDDRLHLRRLEELAAIPVRGTETGANPFFSPDGRWIGFWSDGELKKVPVGGGSAVVLCAAQIPFGVSWGADDTIVYGQGAQGIWRVPAAGGSPEQLVKVNAGETAHGPQILPGGRVLFTVATSADWNDAQIVVQAPDTGDRKVLLKGGTDARYLSMGHLVYAVRNNLLAAPFDVRSMSIMGAPVSLVDDVAQPSMNPSTAQTGAAHFSVSANGTLVYVPASALDDVATEDPPRTLVWVDREGREESLGVMPRAYLYPRLSPDGTRIAVDVRDRENDIWVWDLARRTLTRVTSDPGFDMYPVWTVDGRRLLFTSTRGARPGIFSQAVGGAGTAERLTENVRTQVPLSVSPDGTRAIIGHQGVGPDYDLLMLSSKPSVADSSTQTVETRQSALSEAQPLIRTQFDEINGVISPDGRWLAYQSNTSGQWEIYVRPFPNVDDGLWQVSTAGGQEPLFSSTGRELFFRGLDRSLMAVTVAPSATWSAGAPKQFVPGRYFSATSNRVGRSYDATRDGRRFVMIKEEETGGGTQTPDSLIVVQNWDQELQRLVPAQ